MTDSWLLLITAIVVATAWVSVHIVHAITEVQLAKHGLIEVGGDCSGDCAVYDLYEFTTYLDEKGALREGFGQDHLIEDYIHANHVD